MRELAIRLAGGLRFSTGRVDDRANDCGGALYRMWRGAFGEVPGRTELAFHLGEAFQHVMARVSVGKGFVQAGYDIGRGEVFLYEFGDDLPPGDQVDHGEARDFDSWFAQH